MLTGNPTKAGKYNINLTALNDVGYVEKTPSLTVNTVQQQKRFLKNKRASTKKKSLRKMSRKTQNL